jgi:predicted amidophosphoribosyltransferase
MNDKCNNYKVAITRDSTKFCAKCGDKISDLETCGYCDHEFFPLDKFCEFCGRPRG